MKDKEIADYVQAKIEPMPPSFSRQASFRVSATMCDGTFLPCVVVTGREHEIELAIRRLDETRGNPKPYVGYRGTVSMFVTERNAICAHNLSKLGPSPFAIPAARMDEINGETSMGWTEFYAIMQDGKEFQFGTTFPVEFFDMPKGYVATDIIKIIPAVREEAPRCEDIYRDKPFFTCFVDGL